MPREGDPRVSLRLDPAEYAMLETAAGNANVAVGALVRECVRRSATAVAADASAGRVTLRRRSASAPVPASAAPEPTEAQRYVAGLRDRYGVKTARELAFERQKKLNERKT